MVRGGPDWGAAAPTATIATVDDLGELAARLGSPVTFDRRGNVVYIDQMQWGIESWVQTNISGTGAIAWSADRYLSHGKSLSIAPTNGTVSQIEAARYYPTLRPGQVGVELALSWGDLADQTTLILIPAASEFPRRSYSLRLSGAGVLQYQANGGGWVNLASNSDLVVAAAGRWHFVKLVVDTTNHKWVRLIYDNTEYDLSSIVAAEGVFSTVGPLIAIRSLSEAPSNGIVYVDNVIFTQNEP